MSPSRLRSFAFLVVAGCLGCLDGCLDRPPGLPEANEPPRSAAEADAGLAPTLASRAEDSSHAKGLGELELPPPEAPEPAPAVEATPVAQPADGKDPTGGKFTLEEATAGLAGSGALVATIRTSKGDMTCSLYDDKAPNTVANFVGLARGVRPFKSHLDGKWVKKPIYDGTTFHRVIKGFMIQGGDPQGTGAGEPGYVIADEIWSGARHDRAGLLCMANRGKNTNGAQFFITDASAPHLDGNYTIFGECTPTSVVRAIASVPKSGDDRPLTPVTIKKVEIRRAAPKG